MAGGFAFVIVGLIFMFLVSISPWLAFIVFLFVMGWCATLD